MTPSTNVSSFKELLQSAKNVIVVAGAGLSAGSGIPTFRGKGGLWKKHNAMSLATPEAFKKDPSLVWQFYDHRRETALKCDPNKAHDALAQFSFASCRTKLGFSNIESFTLITQNVDCLSRRALEKMAQSMEPSPMYEMHGSLFDVICTNEPCGLRAFNIDSPICPSLGSSSTGKIPIADLPRCATCQSLVRPGVVWFGEIPMHMGVIDKLVEKADICLVVGTSSTVNPAAGFAYRVSKNGGQVAVFNLENDTIDAFDIDYMFLGPCEETLPKALGIE